MNTHYELISPSVIQASGQLYHYDSLVTLNSAQYASGEAAHAYRMGENLAQARGIEPENQERYSLQGTLSEVAFYVALQLSGYRIDFGKGPDATVSGYEIDVKASNRPNLLVAKRHLEEHPDWIYCNLQQVAPNKFRLMGWLHGHEVKERHSRILTDGRPPAYLIPFERLRPFRAKIGAPLDNLLF